MFATSSSQPAAVSAMPTAWWATARRLVPAGALQSDTLSAGGKKVLQAALVQSQKTQAAFAAAFGGGE